MWKSKLTKSFSLALVLSLLFALPVFAQAATSDFQELQELASNLSQESYQQEMTQIRSLTALVLQDIQQSQLQPLDSSLLQSLERCEKRMSSSEYRSMKLSEQLKVIKESQSLSMQLIQNYLTQQEMLSTLRLSTLSNMKSLLSHYDKLLEILQKIIKSQTEDVRAVVQEIASANEATEHLKSNLTLCQALAEKQAEEIKFREREHKRLRTLSYVELSVGVSSLVIGCLPIWTDSQQNIKNLFLGIGTTSSAFGAATFVFTWRF